MSSTRRTAFGSTLAKVPRLARKTLPTARLVEFSLPLTCNRIANFQRLLPYEYCHF